MLLLGAMMLLFAMMMEDPSGSEKKPTTSQLIGTAGLGCSVILLIGSLIFGILMRIAN